MTGVGADSADVVVGLSRSVAVAADVDESAVGLNRGDTFGSAADGRYIHACPTGIFHPDGFAVL